MFTCSVNFTWHQLSEHQLLRPLVPVRSSLHDFNALFLSFVILSLGSGGPLSSDVLILPLIPPLNHSVIFDLSTINKQNLCKSKNYMNNFKFSHWNHHIFPCCLQMIQWLISRYFPEFSHRFTLNRQTYCQTWDSVGKRATMERTAHRGQEYIKQRGRWISRDREEPAFSPFFCLNFYTEPPPLFPAQQQEPRLTSVPGMCLCLRRSSGSGSRVSSVCTFQQHVSASGRCPQTPQSSCTPAGPRACRRASSSPIATSSQASQGWLRGFLTCGRRVNASQWNRSSKMHEVLNIFIATYLFLCNLTRQQSNIWAGHTSCS